MVIERPYEVGQSRRRVWCLFSELHEESEGVYSFVNLPNEALGDGSDVIVMDKPLMLLFYSATTHLLYDWSEE